MLVVVSGRQVLGYEPRTGTRLWTVGLSSCQQVSWTGPATVVVRDACASPATLRIFDATSGRPVGSWQPPAPGGGDGEPGLTPWGCAVGRSECAMLQVGASSEWRLRDDGTAVREPHAKPGDLLLGDAFVEWRADAYVSVVEAATGRQRWIMPLSGYVVAADARGVYAVSRRDNLLVFDAVTGSLRSRLRMRYTETGRYGTGQVYLRGHYLAIERITGKPNESDNRYYFGATPVLWMAI
jgi:outer membrane protein assembly factor BamB